MEKYVLVTDDDGTRWETFDSLVPVTEKGGVLSHTEDALAAVSVGADAQILVSDSTADCGISWADLKIPMDTVPASPSAGHCYYDSATSTFYVHNGTAWTHVHMTT